MSSEALIDLQAVEKHYDLWTSPAHRLAAALGVAHKVPRRVQALHPIDLSVGRGEVIGLVGRNGAGKSTLLQCIAGTVRPSAGRRIIRGRLAALLELGAGFQPQMTGRENIRLNGLLLGMTQAELRDRTGDIIAFSEIAHAIDQPVRTYSTGMAVRLAFAIATSVDPDILLIDEALSVGDGAFARKSFDRILALRDRGVSIVLCSHSLYHIEAICQRALWIREGQLWRDGPAGEVVTQYRHDLEAVETPAAPIRPDQRADAHLVRIWGVADGRRGTVLPCTSGKTDLSLFVQFRVPPGSVPPHVGVTFAMEGQSVLTSCGTQLQDRRPQVGADGTGFVRLDVPACPFTRGRVQASVYLLCERGLHVHDAAAPAVTFEVAQDDLVQGSMRLPHHWDVDLRATGAEGG